MFDPLSKNKCELSQEVLSSVIQLLREYGRDYYSSHVVFNIPSWCLSFNLRVARMFVSHTPAVHIYRWMNASCWFSVFLCPGDRLRGSEEELARAVGAVEVEEGDSDWAMASVDQNSVVSSLGVTKSGPLWPLSRIMVLWCIVHATIHIWL